MPNAADGIYYVSTKGKDTNDGLSVDTAFLTIGAALKALGQNPGRIQLMAGSYQSPKAGILLGAHQSIQGVGGQATVITFETLDKSATCGLHLSGGRGAARDLWLHAAQTAKNITMLRISCLWNGSTHNVRVDNVLVENGVGCIAFGIGDVGVTTGDPLFQLDPNTGLPKTATKDSSDVAQICLTHCFSLGVYKDPASIHLQVGAGGTGNVLDISSFGGGSGQNGHAIRIAGGALVSTGMSMGYSAVADIGLAVGPGGAVVISGGRSENSERFIESTMAGIAGSSCKISDYSVIALQNTDGQAIRLANAPITLENLTLLGDKVPQYIAMEGVVTDSVFNSPVTVTNCVSQHPFPFRSPWSRPGKIFHAQGQKFVGDSDFELQLRKAPADWIRRLNVPPAAGAQPPVSPLNPAFFDSVDVRLSSDAPPFVLGPGVPGQNLTICFVQDGVGMHAYKWPASCAFDGGKAPDNVLVSRNRQTCHFKWTGRFWEQQGSVTNVRSSQVAVPVNPVSDKFSGARNPSKKPNPYNLGTPDGIVPAPSLFDWEHVPGGGNLGATGKMCVCNCLGWVGDNEFDGLGLVGIAAAAAVIETGMKVTPKKGIEATFKWQFAEGIIAHYLDDQTFCVFFLTETMLHVKGFSHGTPATGNGFGNAVLTKSLKPIKLKPGSLHTLRVQCTPTGFVVTLDDGKIELANKPSLVINLSNTTQNPDRKNFAGLTKHGIFAASTAATFSSFSVS